MGTATSTTDAKSVPPGLLARRKRIRALQIRVTRNALALTAVVWVAIFGQFASGNDPVMGGADDPARQQAGGTSSTQSSAVATALADSAEAGTVGLQSQAPLPTPLTTSQS